MIVLIRSEFASQFERILAEYAMIAAEHETLALEGETEAAPGSPGGDRARGPELVPKHHLD